MDIFKTIAKLFTPSILIIVNCCSHFLFSADFFVSKHLVCPMYCFKCQRIARSGIVFIGGAISKISLKLLLTTFNAELGIGHAKEPSGLDKTFLLKRV